MVMGATHAVSGAVLGLAVAQVLPPDWGGPTSTAEAFTFAGVCAGAALLPDLDTNQSTVARSFGPASKALAGGIDEASLWFYRLTRGRKDPKRRGGHRTLTHTALFAISLAFGVSALVVKFGQPAIVGTLFVTLGLALRGLAGGWAAKYGWLAVTAVAAGLSMLVWNWYPDEVGSRALGVAVGLGCAVHCLGDAITKEGVPFLAPFVPWRGRRWWELRLPSMLSIRAGGTFERAVLGPVLTLAAVGLVLWALQGVPEALTDALGEIRGKS
ncbi:metal-dependent hydrolase [Rhodococcus tukisamuensis]|uniref:LexA-binding, inner membrane-associated putative hydrolase n=1 Tax=Rhodococcus tukisamuensis TaxID=168276 RepID=A0A1G7EGD4_9NOCA|nr:metal-dependent hydrolase [Rhodococcus tukisamuensis]SDE62505.1 LexA-binding, inner membrane-associated putative hydrolase [Rhodococcus tukisamuensis]